MFERSDGFSALHGQCPSFWQRISQEPSKTLVTALYSWHQKNVFKPDPINPVSVVCISDTHNNRPLDIPVGEILIHAGDMTQTGTLDEIQSTLSWIASLPHAHKIVIAGNHDVSLDPSYLHPQTDPNALEFLDWGDVIYLNSESTTIACANGRKIRIYGSPLTPRQGNWAFQYPRDQDVWSNKIPTDTDILITHGPPRGHLDAGRGGCRLLLEEIWRKKPRLHVFGHIHEGHGMEWMQYDGLQRVYEKTMMESGRWWNLGRAILEFVVARFAPAKEARTLLVNAALAGGRWDEIKQRPVTVYI